MVVRSPFEKHYPLAGTKQSGGELAVTELGTCSCYFSSREVFLLGLDSFRCTASAVAALVPPSSTVKRQYCGYSNWEIQARLAVTKVRSLAPLEKLWAQTGQHFFDRWKSSAYHGAEVYVRITQAGGHKYARPVESFREGGKVRKRMIANLGRVDEIKRNPGTLESLAGAVNGLMSRAENSVSKADFDAAPA